MFGIFKRARATSAAVAAVYFSLGGVATIGFGAAGTDRRMITGAAGVGAGMELRAFTGS
jgi:hypothetical protein